MASGSITSWETDGKTVETAADFILGGSEITADGDCSYEIKRGLLLLLLSHFSRVRLLVPHRLKSTRLIHPWDFPSKSTGVGWHCLLRKDAYDLERK